MRAIARRAAGRALAERGLAAPAAQDPDAEARVAVRVTAPPERAPARRPGREVVSADCLAETPAGGAFQVPDGAAVTPLAREQAAQRGVRLVERSRGAARSIAVGADHAGFALKADVLARLRELGHRVLDVGAPDDRPTDYPDYARAVAEAVAAGQSELGIVVDAAGVGSAIAANKVPGVRAATCADPATAAGAREHAHANVLALGARALERTTALEIVRAFLAAEPAGGRHARRVAKVTDLERRYGRVPDPSGVRR